MQQLLSKAVDSGWPSGNYFVTVVFSVLKPARGDHLVTFSNIVTTVEPLPLSSELSSSQNAVTKTLPMMLIAALATIVR
jgi:hypothetical protein